MLPLTFEEGFFHIRQHLRGCCICIKEQLHRVGSASCNIATAAVCVYVSGYEHIYVLNTYRLQLRGNWQLCFAVTRGRSSAHGVILLGLPTDTLPKSVNGAH